MRGGSQRGTLDTRNKQNLPWKTDGMSSKASFGAQLRQLREAAALTQEELAARAGLTVKAIGAWNVSAPWPRP
jgi:DNA-binding XRE family transcriptional regulator